MQGAGINTGFFAKVGISRNYSMQHHALIRGVWAHALSRRLGNLRLRLLWVASETIYMNDNYCILISLQTTMR